MSKADEMFEKLGYEIEDEKICPHSYKYIKENKESFTAKEIIIEKSSKWIDICYYKVGTDGKLYSIICMEHYLSIQELQAINMKCKELRMVR